LSIEVHPAAEAEAREAFRRYHERDPVVGMRFLAALDRAIEHVQANPNRWPAFVHDTRRILIRRFPFSIIYRADSERVLVLAVAHQKRRPGYWNRRRG